MALSGSFMGMAGTAGSCCSYHRPHASGSPAAQAWALGPGLLEAWHCTLQCCSIAWQPTHDTTRHTQRKTHTQLCEDAVHTQICATCVACSTAAAQTQQPGTCCTQHVHRGVHSMPYAGRAAARGTCSRSMTLLRCTLVANA